MAERNRFLDEHVKLSRRFFVGVGAAGVAVAAGWRVALGAEPPQPELAKALEHPNRAVQMTASRLLVEKNQGQASVEAILSPPEPAHRPERTVEHRAGELRKYQDAAYAEKYLQFVQRVAARAPALEEPVHARNRKRVEIVLEMRGARDGFEQLDDGSRSDEGGARQPRAVGEIEVLRVNARLSEKRP